MPTGRHDTTPENPTEPAAASAGPDPEHRTDSAATEQTDGAQQADGVQQADAAGPSRPRAKRRSFGEAVVPPAAATAPTKSGAAMRLSKPARTASDASADPAPATAEIPAVRSSDAEPTTESLFTPSTASGAGVGVEPGEGNRSTLPVEQEPVEKAPADQDRRRIRRLTVLGVLAVLLLSATVVLGVAWNSARSSGPLANQAFVDGAATSELVGQMTSAVTTAYSFDYTTLDANEQAAKGVVSGDFATQFGKVFQSLKQLAPQQQAVTRTTVPAAAVSQLQGDRARLLMMVDQSGTKGPGKEPTGATARLVVDGQRVDGHWKISGVTPE